MKYDETLKKYNCDYGFVKGDEHIAFVKTGLNGNYLGYENKYLIMAHKLHEKYGCSVIVSSNPDDSRNQTNTDRQILEQYISENHIECPKLFFFGHSNGGIKGILLTDTVPFQKMVLVNMPLMVNFHKMKRTLSSIPETEIITVYGEYDPSVKYLPFLDGKLKNVKVFIFPRADHHFKGLLNEFIALGDLLLN